MATKKPAADPVEEFTPPEVEVIKTTKTEDGLAWHYEEEGGSVRTYVHTKDGRTLNVLHSNRDTGRAALREFLNAE